MKHSDNQNRQRAQELAWQAMDAVDYSEARRLISEALELDPRNADAIRMSVSGEPDIAKAISALRQAVQFSHEDLGGSAFFRENSGYFWGLVETRPYMRARAALVYRLLEAGELEEASSEMEDLLELCPDDNLGLRNPLMGCYLEMGRLEEVRQLLQQFSESHSATHAWGAVLERLLSGDHAGAEKALATARRVNPHLEDLLTGRRQLSRYIPTGYQMGSVEEAEIAMEYVGRAWIASKESCIWLFDRSRGKSAREPGRNDSCPCGSGRKYKKCCLGKPQLQMDTAGSTARNEPMMLELEQLLKDANPQDEAQLQQLLEQFQASQNVRAVDEFEGLSPEQMRMFLSKPFNAPEFLEFSRLLPAEPTGLLAGLLRKLLEALGEEGLKATAKGNLPRATVIDIARQVLGDADYEEYFNFSVLRGEDDFHELQVAKLLAERQGLIKLAGSKWKITDNGRKRIEATGLREIYPLILKDYALKVEWGSWDGHPPVDILQDAFAFSLRLLATHGSEWKTDRFYSDRFMRAFPMVKDELLDDLYPSPARACQHVYRARFLIRFAEYFGLIEIDCSFNLGKRILDDELRIRATPLLAQVVTFRV